MIFIIIIILKSHLKARRRIGGASSEKYRTERNVVVEAGWRRETVCFFVDKTTRKKIHLSRRMYKDSPLIDVK